jgi:hypothetical protein
MLRAVVLGAAASLLLAAPALAQSVANGVHDGMLALDQKGSMR